MSTDKNQADRSSCCASCGIPECDVIKLKKCADCDLVRYCSDACQRNHKPQHKEACKKRAAELRDEILFRQPVSSHVGDCPICCLPLSQDESKSSLYSCCSKIICKGCNFANELREAEGRIEHSCPFCHTPIPDTDELKKFMMKRIEANDPIAMTQWGKEQYDKGDYSDAFECFTRAAGLGDVVSHYNLSCCFGGHPNVRYNLGWNEWSNNDWDNNDTAERAVKHWIIAANQGHDQSIKPLMEYFKRGLISNEELAATLRAHQAAVDATKSPQREAAEECFRKSNQH
eukprot:scaffold22253_cov72-Skeletonema_dohrnii-CCMP3373.AAC.2